MNTYCQGRRQTGRTTKMLTYIMVQALQKPSHLCVVGASGHHMWHLFRMFSDLLEANDVAFREYRTEPRINLSASSVSFYNHTPDLRGVRADSVTVFEDHYTIESRLQKDLQELDRWFTH